MEDWALIRRLVAEGRVGQQANLLEHLAAEILRLVDDQHRAPPARVRVEQVAVERVDERLEADGAGRVRDVQLVADRGQQLDGRERRIEDHRHVDLGRQLLEQCPAEGRLAGADLPRELDEPAPRPQAPQEVRERLPVAVGQEEIARVRRDRERLLGEPEV